MSMPAPTPSFTGYPFPYDLQDLLGGGARILAKVDDGLSASIPARIEDIFATDGGYLPVDPWFELGATKDQFQYGRGFTQQNWEIQQTNGAVISEITQVTRDITLSMAAFNAKNLQLLENAPAIADVASGPHQSGQQKIAFGSFATVQRYKFAFVSMRSPTSGLVNESGGAKRGRFVVGVAYSAQLAAENLTLDQAKGALTASNLKFQLYPDPTQPTGEEWGTWFLENPGTITAT